MKYFRPLLTTLAAVLCSAFCFAQVSGIEKHAVDTARIVETMRTGSVFGPNQFNFISWQDNMMGASPEAAKMTKYADAPMSNAYGQAEIGIPIYTVKSRQLSLPISLSYDCSGIKPDEISGIVGLGWSLQAGGVITRNIIGLEDSGVEIPAETNNPAYAEYLAGQSNSIQDTNYDRYYYSFCGHSGSFYIIPGRGIVPLEPTELVISGTGFFTITDTDGTQYVFNRPETATRYMGSTDPNAPLASNSGAYYNKPMAWHLTEIRSMDGTDTININYRQLSSFSNVRYSYYRSISFPYRYEGDGEYTTNLSGGFDPTPSFQTKEWSFTTTSTWQPYVVDSISFCGGSITFEYEGYAQANALINNSRRSYPSFLSSISLKDRDNQTVFNWSFTKDVTGDYRTLLSSVTQKGRNGSIIEKWTMEYMDKNTTMSENAVDLFGYYNGAGGGFGKAFLRPYNDESTVPFSPGNRSFNSACVGKLSLQSITTASGTKTQYFYWPNSISSDGLSNLFPSSIEIGQRVEHILTYDLSEGAERLVRRRDFSYSNPEITIPKYAFQMGAYISTTEFNICESGIGVGHWYGTQSPIRVGSIVYNDQSNLPGMPLENARIFYGMVKEDVTDDSLKVARTVWEYDTTSAQSTGGGGNVWEPSDIHDNTYTNPSETFNHFHQRVPLYIPRNGSPSNPTTPLGYHIQDQNRPQLSQPSIVTHFKQQPNGQFIKTSQTVYDYQTTYGYLQEGLTLSYRVSTCTNGYEDTTVHCLSDVDQQQVDRKIIYRRLKERLDKEFLDDGTVKTVKTTYSYDFTPNGRYSFYSGNTYFSDTLRIPSMGKLQSPRQEKQVYDDDSNRTYFRNIIYPDELTHLSTYDWADSLVDRHFLRPIGEELIVGTNQPQMSGQYISWGLAPVSSWENGQTPSALMKPRTMEVYRNGINIGPTLTYSAYDALGSPLCIQIQGQPAKTYVWSYNHSLPVAEVTGMSFTQLRDSLDTYSRIRLDGIANADAPNTSQGDVAFLRNTLRNGLNGALTILRTYTTPFGPTLEEDSSGRSINYTYDAAGRLSAVKDEQGNKVLEYVYQLTHGGLLGRRNRIESKTYTSTSLYGDPIIDIDYFDGLGRTVQKIVVGAATNGQHMITPIVPDFLDREDVRTYLPYAASGSEYYRSNALYEQQTYYGSGVKAYGENHYEVSSRNRILSSTLPGFTEGTGYQLFGSIYPLPKALHLSYNASNNTISATGYYPDGRFKVSGSTGQDGSMTLSYNDEFETPYAEYVRTEANASSLGTFAATYYIRDSIGRIVCVVPPAEAVQLTTTTVAFSAANCYTYQYDKRDRVVRRQLPAQAAETIVYNNADLPISRSRMAADGLATETIFTEYDGLNRVVKEKYQYGNHAPVTLAEYVYDSYPSWAPTFIVESGIATNADLDNRTKGLKTAERIALLPPDISPSNLTPGNITGAELRAFYYDAKGNIIQEAKHNATGGVNYISSLYGFAGNLLHQRQCIAVGSGSALNTIDRIYTYDSRLRPLTVSVQLDNGTPGTLSYAYDDLQRVQSVSLGNNVDTLQYSYTLQGWVSSIKASKWEEDLSYQSPSHAATDSLPGKTGFITEWTQQQKGTSADGATVAETYAYSYDKAGRLTGSLRYEESSPQSTNTLTEQNITYDHSGNLLTLKRFGPNSGTTATDSLVFSYSGPRRNGWIYDTHGNVAIDPMSGSHIFWNVLDMPCAIAHGNAFTQRHYLADGTLVGIDDGTTMRMNVGDAVFVFSPTTAGLVSVAWEGGMLLPGTGADKVLYNIKDHLGSVRTVVDGTGSVRQRFDYYPYGTVSRCWSSSPTGSPDKRYRFGGKEVTGFMMSSLIPPTIPYLDFGARLYNPSTVMWMSQDPMAEDYYYQTPYLYCAASPNNVIDPNGKDWFQNLNTGELYYNKDYSHSDVGKGYMSDNPGDWIYFAPNDAFCISDIYLTANYASYDNISGFYFNPQQAEEAMHTVGYRLRPYTALYEVTKQTDFYSEGLDIIQISQQFESLLGVEKKKFIPNYYYESYTSEVIGGISRLNPIVFPRRYTVETWKERRTYSYGPTPQAKDSATIKSIILQIMKSIAQSL